MHEISQVKVSLEFAFTDGEQHSQSDMQIKFSQCPTITSYIVVTDCKLVNFYPHEDRMYINVITESKYLIFNLIYIRRRSVQPEVSRAICNLYGISWVSRDDEEVDSSS